MTPNEQSPLLLHEYINTSLVADEIITAARHSAHEYGLAIPDNATGSYLSYIAQLLPHPASIVIISPSAGLIALHLESGRVQHGSTDSHYTCIDPEVEHHRLAREAFKTLDIPSNSYRFIPSRPLEVISRLTDNNYDLVISSAPVEELVATVDACLPILKKGGQLILLDSLMDGLLLDESRTDRTTLLARHADNYIHSLELPQLRLPLGAGLISITKV